MNRKQTIALGAALVNGILILLFPPYDYLPVERLGVPSFSGFHWILGANAHRAINTNFLSLELIVILINACIAWLVLRDRPLGKRRDTTPVQKGLLGFIAVNLILMLLFPPFENISAVSNAALPSFEGFYFVFADHTRQQLVTSILYIEVALILINGGLLWLFLKDKGAETQALTPEQIRAMAEKLRAAQKKG